MIFTEIDLALEEADFLLKNDYGTHYLLYNDGLYYLLDEEEWCKPQHRGYKLLEIFRSCI